MLYRTDHIKPDGRRLWLYGRGPMPALAPQAVPSPDPQPVTVRTHLRRHPLLEEWVVYAAHRQDRTFLPPADSNPLAPTTDPARPTELPAGDYDVAVFENRFPSLAPDPGEPPSVGGVEVAPGFGRCEVVVFSKDPQTSLGQLPVEQVALILQVWADRTQFMAEQGIRYILPFENRGMEMGVTLHHPHGQIYGYGFVPRLQARIADTLRRHYDATGRDLVVELGAAERERGTHMIAERERAIAFVPPFARYPYEIWVVPASPVPDLAGLDEAGRADLASALSEALRRLDGLWGRPMPYLLTVNQAPTDGEPHPGWTVRIEIWPVRRSPDKLKFLAGTELGAGVFANDVAPERAAAELRAAIP